jgi:hypothetical protein
MRGSSAGGNAEGTQEERKPQRVVGRPFTSETAREAAARRRPKRPEGQTPSTQPVVRDPRLVEEALWRKAQAGDVAAARELRAWREGEESSDVDPWKTISREEREQLLDALRAERTHPPAA